MSVNTRSDSSPLRYISFRGTRSLSWFNYVAISERSTTSTPQSDCDMHGVTYIQESVLERFRKTVDIMVGRTPMRAFPDEYEPKKDKTDIGSIKD